MAVTQIPEWSLGDRLRKARGLTGLSQREFGKRIGVSEDTVKRAEAMAYTPRRAIILGWAVECEVDPYWLETGVAPGTVTEEDTHEYLHARHSVVKSAA